MPGSTYTANVAKNLAMAEAVMPKKSEAKPKYDPVILKSVKVVGV